MKEDPRGDHAFRIERSADDCASTAATLIYQREGLVAELARLLQYIHIEQRQDEAPHNEGLDART